MHESWDDEAMRTPFLDNPAQWALPYNSPYSAGFREASPLPPLMDRDTSSALIGGHITRNLEAEQNMYWIVLNPNMAEQFTETSFQGERRSSNSSNTTDSSYGSNDDFYETLPLESRDFGAPSGSTFRKPTDGRIENQLSVFSPGVATFVSQNLHRLHGETDREKYVGYDASSISTSSRIARNFDDKQDIHWVYPDSNFHTAKQSMEMSFQDERRLSNSSNATDSSYSVDDLHETDHTLESCDTGPTCDSNLKKPIDAWKEVQLQISLSSPGIVTFVPQNLYQPHGEADREKYVYSAKLSPPIFFYAENPYELGIALEEIVKRSRRLRDREELVLEGCGGSISVRVKWPGYPLLSRQLHTRDYRKPPGPITKGRLAKNLAKFLRRFIEKMTTRRMETDADPAWRIGDGCIKFEDLALVSLHHVSKGSWQPQLRLRRQIQGPSSSKVL